MDTCDMCDYERSELLTYAALSGPDSQAQADLNAFRCPHLRVVSLIEDHGYHPVMSGRWSTGKCAICGEKPTRHGDYLRDLAAKIGGDPMDYATKESACPPTS